MVRIGDKSVKVSVQGELDLSTAPQLDEVLQREIGDGHEVVLDVSALEFMDSTGLNAIVSAIRASDSTAAVLKLAPSIPPQVRRVIELTGLNNVLPVSAD